MNRHEYRAPTKNRPMPTEKVKERLATLPRQPGVYFFRDARDTIIYIGKAKILTNRVRSYFTNSYDDGRRQIHALVRNVADVDYIVTASEAEALILEAILIKSHLPRYNIFLKDDKKYPYLMLTDEDFPRLLVTRRVRKGEGRYFGPYTEVRAMRRALETVHRLFPIRTCDPPLPSGAITRPCLQYEIKRCMAPCVGYQTKEEYGELTDQVALFLKGRYDQVSQILTEAMQIASDDLNYERATELRNRLRDVERITEKQRVTSTGMENRDIVAVVREDHEACAVVLEMRSGRVIGRKQHALAVALDDAAEVVMSAFLRQYYLDALTIPPEILLSDPVEDADDVARWLTDQQEDGRNVVLAVPQRGEKARMVEMAGENARLMLIERQTRREKARDRIPHPVSALERDLRLESTPRRIECIDISHTAGSDTVGSLVCFINGKPRKNEYRHFQIRSLGDTPDDYASMREVIRRRYTRVAEEEETASDLLIIDGGKGQLSSAKQVLDEMGFDEQPVMGLAKRLEEVFRPGLPKPVMIPRTSSALKLLQKIRDEAHRFAVEYHRKKRSAHLKASELDAIPGVGDRRKKDLLKHFGSVKQVKLAAVHEIAEVPGIGPQLAEVVADHLKSGGSQESSGG